MNRIFKIYHSLPSYLPSTIVVIAVLLLTLMPVPQKVVPDVDNADKVAHFLMFGAIACIGWLDMALQKHTQPKWTQYLIVAAGSTLLGGVIEVLQGTDFINRSCDFNDFLADAAGAFILPPMVRRLIWYLLPDGDKLTLRTVKKPTPHLEEIYTEAFPPEERRLWHSIETLAENEQAPLQFTELLWMGKPVGMISWWDFPQWAYVEHFAVSKSLRGKGIGALAMKKWMQMTGKGAVLEVEPPEAGPMAARRISFYERLGFRPHSDRPYVQPPYSPGLPPVPLMLMTCGNVRNIAEVENVLHTQVYGTKQ